VLTRETPVWQYEAGGAAPPPFHVIMPADAYPAEGRGPMSVTPGAVDVAPHIVAGPGPGLGQWVGMDPGDPSTWVRPYAPQPGMFTRLHTDQAAAARQHKRVKARQ
jgi:hypothetical protein